MGALNTMNGLNLPARSWLFVPATSPERFIKAASSGADRVVIDLEDAVDASAKVEARRSLKNASLPDNLPLYVRINGVETPWFEADMALVGTLPVAGILLPKAETAAHVARAAAALATGQHIVAMIETAVGLWNVLEVAKGSRVERLAFGALDFQVDTGITDEEPNELELAYARSRIVIASRVAGILGAIDSISTTLDDAEILGSDATRGRRFGFAGKLCIHPKQVAPTHRSFLPRAEEREWASGLMEALAARPESQRGSFSFRGAMVDRPVIERARHILAVSGS